MDEEVLSTRALGRATLARQLLLGRHELPAPEAIGRLAGMQAQEPGPPYLGLWSRLKGFDEAELAEAIESRQVVRATVMRGTLHLLPSKDFIRLRSAVAPAVGEAMLRVLGRRAEGLDVPELVRQARSLFDESDVLSAKQLRDALAECHPEADIRALAAVVRTHIPLVRVPDGGRWGFTPKAPFADAERWLGKPLRKSADRNELVRRYLGAFGPATTRDAEAWAGVGGLGEVFEGLRSELEAFRDEKGRELFDLPGAPRPSEDAEALCRPHASHHVGQAGPSAAPPLAHVLPHAPQPVEQIALDVQIACDVSLCDAELAGVEKQPSQGVGRRDDRRRSTIRPRRTAVPSPNADRHRAAEQGTHDVGQLVGDGRS